MGKRCWNMTFCIPQGSVATLYRWGSQIYNLLVCNFLMMPIIKKYIKGMVFDVTQTSQLSWKLKSKFGQLQNSFFKFKCPSFRLTSSKYSVTHQTCGELCVEQTSKIWYKHIHAFLRNFGFRVGAFCFDAPFTLRLVTLNDLHPCTDETLTAVTITFHQKCLNYKMWSTMTIVSCNSHLKP